MIFLGHIRVSGLENLTLIEYIVDRRGRLKAMSHLPNEIVQIDDRKEIEKGDEKINIVSCEES